MAKFITKTIMKEYIRHHPLSIALQAFAFFFFGTMIWAGISIIRKDIPNPFPPEMTMGLVLFLFGIEMLKIFSGAAETQRQQEDRKLQRHKYGS